MTHHEIVTRIREYIAENFLYMRQRVSYDDTDSLLGRGIIDSTGIVELVALVQDDYGIAVDDAEITEENFGSLELIARFVQFKRGVYLVA